jgi:hypothetical protein
MTLALLAAFFAHPLAWLLGIAALGVIGLAVNATGPVVNFGAFTYGTLSQMLAVFGTQYNTFAAGITTGVIPANVLTGALDVFLVSAATTPGNQTTRTAVQLFADAAAQFGVSLTDPALINGLQYTLTISQSGANTFTLVGGTGVTIVGTATIATNTNRQFVVNLTPTAATFTSVAAGDI